MTNKEWYKRAFSSLHTSPDFMVQLEKQQSGQKNGHLRGHSWS